MSETGTKVYFVTSGLREEIQVIKRLRPKRLLCSYWYFKNKPLAGFCEELGYRPEILLDSGAYSAFTKGKHVNLLDYIDYIRANKDYIYRYITLDVIGNPQMTLLLWDLMNAAGLAPVPVIHYGDDLDYLPYYLAEDVNLVALGGTVPIRDKKVVAEWCSKVKQRCQGVDLHLLGSSSRQIMECGAVESCDSSSWYLMAVNGKPARLPGNRRPTKITRAEANMLRIMEAFNEVPVPADNCSIEHTHGEI